MTTNQQTMSEVVRPPVIKWFRVYCWVLCVMYLAVAAFSLVFFLGDPAELEMSRMAALVAGTGILLVGLGLLVASLLPLVVRPRPWLWTYDLVIICLGMTSACFLPACIPLLIFWMKPDAKSYFGKA
jgi:hypothetical protein